MSNHDFILKSGEKLHISTPAFEDSVALIEAVKKVTNGMDPTLSVDDAILANSEVRKAMYPCFPYAMYGIYKLTVGLFDDPKMGAKARGDYFEICSRIIEVVSKDFFLNLSLRSTTLPRPIQEENPELP